MAHVLIILNTLPPIFNFSYFYDVSLICALTRFFVFWLKGELCRSYHLYTYYMICKNLKMSEIKSIPTPGHIDESIIGWGRREWFAIKKVLSFLSTSSELTLTSWWMCNVGLIGFIRVSFVFFFFLEEERQNENILKANPPHTFAPDPLEGNFWEMNEYFHLF